MHKVQLDGILQYRFEGLAGVDGLFHTVLTRIGGVSQGPFATLNLGHTVGDDPEAVRENHRRALLPLGVDPERVVCPWQVHGARVDVVGPEHLGTVRPRTDALVTEEPGVPLMMRFGDCTPILLFDRARRVAGLAHAGWRGVVAGVVEASVRTMEERLGCTPSSIWAGIGPTIGPCCYEVGADVAHVIAAACPGEARVIRRVNGHVRADLPAAVEAQLRDVGVREVEQANLCTSCRVDEFFSHRAEEGRTGRFGIVMGLDHG
ncbi:MAG: peptidoglycan editing factor PgeF [Anaerolineae bacterium]|jgi:YfiH family protein